MALEKELGYFEAHKQEFLNHYEGLYLLIKDEQLVGAFTRSDEAYAAGLAQLGNQPFLIKQVLREEHETHIPALVLGLIGANL